MNCFKSSLKLTLLTLLTCGLVSPAFATPDNDNSIFAADFEGNLNSGQGFLQIKGDVTTTDDLEDFRKVLLTGRSNLRLKLEGVAPNGGRTDLLLVRDSNNNGQIDRNQGEVIGQSRDSFSHQITRQYLTAGDYFVIIRSRQFSSNKVQYQVSADARV
ncbi:hypothetical protein [Nostoc sp. LPT]|uniref:hypothetical protein n=1 Tax=Nostoc sp. LPT TaxID=2815387 RepID=UPI001D7DB6C9|nr:hypothetical protein [Nostoc sp. LPT]MBN4006882.1 hypothetical protein [Nostoc sp. LPT]